MQLPLRASGVSQDLIGTPLVREAASSLLDDWLDGLQGGSDPHEAYERLGKNVTTRVTVSVASIVLPPSRLRGLDINNSTAT